MEFALAMPVLLMVLVSALELGHLIYYSVTIEKGLRSGVTYAARNPVPLTAAVEDTTINLTMTASLDGAADYLVPGYKKAVDDGLTPVTVTTRTYTKTNAGSEDTEVEIIVLSVEVPYIPLLSAITENFFGTFAPTIKLTHEQAVIGD